jgi:hypothetical protein
VAGMLSSKPCSRLLFDTIVFKRLVIFASMPAS